jgi:hypothetical protein
LFRSSAGVALGMSLATASAVTGVLILVAPYASPFVAFGVAGGATLPLVLVWRSFALEDAELPTTGARALPHRSRGCQAEPPTAR